MCHQLVPHVGWGKILALDGHTRAVIYLFIYCFYCLFIIFMQIPGTERLSVSHELFC
jgi:hypothetical protein